MSSTINSPYIGTTTGGTVGTGYQSAISFPDYRYGTILDRETGLYITTTQNYTKWSKLDSFVSDQWTICKFYDCYAAIVSPNYYVINEKENRFSEHTTFEEALTKYRMVA